jgi:6-phosphogluconate dehydrogenase
LFLAGKAVDDFIQQLIPLLEKGDIIIDGGNSEYQDTKRRTAELDAKGLLYVGSGVSGGEEGARYGPSLMPGGNPKAWPHIKDIFQVPLYSMNCLFFFFRLNKSKLIFFFFFQKINVLK